MFRTVPLSIIRNFSLYTQQWYMSYSLRAGSGRTSWSFSQAVSKPVCHIPLLCVQWKTPDDGQRNRPKYVEFYSKNKFEKLLHLVGFVIRIYHDAWSCKRQVWPRRVWSVFMGVSYEPGDHTTRSQTPVGSSLSDVCRCMISDFCRELAESCALQGYYAAREMGIFLKKLPLLAA